MMTIQTATTREESTRAATREVRVRRAAARQEMYLQKSRRRDEMAKDFGGFWLLDADNNVVFPRNAEAPTASLDEVEAYLRTPWAER